MFKYCLFFICLCFSCVKTYGQVNLGGDISEIDFSNPREYEIAGLTVSGIQYLDETVLKTLSGLTIGDKIKIPGDKLAKAIESLWKQGLLSDIIISATKIEGNLIFLDLQLKEMPRLSKFSFKGITKNEADKLREKMSLVAGKVVTENVIKTNETIIANYFKEKGFLNVEVKMDLITDTSLINSNFMIVNIKKNGKIKIHEIRFTGLEAFTPQKLKSKMKGTKENIGIPFLQHRNLKRKHMNRIRKR